MDGGDLSAGGRFRIGCLWPGSNDNAANDNATNDNATNDNTTNDNTTNDNTTNDNTTRGRKTTVWRIVPVRIGRGLSVF
jgi:hypothetical protein